MYTGSPRSCVPGGASATSSNRMRSLRGRLFVYLIGGAALVLLVAGFALRTIVVDALQKEFDRALLAKARGLVALTEQEGDQDRVRVPERAHARVRHAGPSPILRALARGRLARPAVSVVRASDETRAASLVRSPLQASTPRFRDVRLPDGRRGRQIQLDFVPALDTEDESRLGGSDRPPAPRPCIGGSPDRDPARRARAPSSSMPESGAWSWSVAGLGAGLMLALAGLMQLALRVGLRSLDRLTGQVRALDVNSLDARVAVARRRPTRSRWSSSRSTPCSPGSRPALSGSVVCRATSPTSSRRRSPSSET